MFFGCLFDICILESMVLYIYETHLCLFCYIVTCKYDPTRRLAKNGLHGVENKILKDSKLRCKKVRGVKNRKK